tara:strand:+ start:139 stop:324 length:186 start_codon:yes stop_codon:yes gene_type:complete
MEKKSQYVNNVSEAAIRALKEVKERNNKKNKNLLQKEIGGRDGPEPTRFGDWEKKGIVSDF